MTLKTKRIIIVVIIAAVASAALAAGLAFALAPMQTFAIRYPFGMHGPHIGGFGAWQHMGQASTIWQGWTGSSGFILDNESRNANWTGSVSIDSLRNNIIDLLKSKVKIDITDATTMAKKTLGSETRISDVMLAPVNGYLVYLVYGIDNSNNVHKLVIDVGNGNVLENSQIDNGTQGFEPRQNYYGFSDGGIWN